jgi:hypothetical protein
MTDNERAAWNAAINHVNECLKSYGFLHFNFTSSLKPDRPCEASCRHDQEEHYTGGCMGRVPDPHGGTDLPCSCKLTNGKRYPS